MSNAKDWLPTTREGILSMDREWITVTNAQAAAWGIPKTTITELTKLNDQASEALNIAQNETTRTPVANAQCKEAFIALINRMRDFKRRYFLSPPLLDSDYIALGLKPHDTIPSLSGPPTAQVMVETYLVGRHELGVRIIYVNGNSADTENKGYRIWYSVVGPGEQPPANPGDLRKSFYTKRKKDVINFEYEDSGKHAYFAVQVENDGKKGPWGPLMGALIP